MTRVARSVFLFGIYVALIGLGLILAPNLVIGPFGFAEAREPWIHVMGVVVFSIGAMYIQAGRINLAAFFPWTVWLRAWVLAAFTGLALTGVAEPMLIVFGVVDGAGAAWTAWAMRRGPASLRTPA